MIIILLKIVWYGVYYCMMAMVFRIMVWPAISSFATSCNDNDDSMAARRVPTPPYHWISKASTCYFDVNRCDNLSSPLASHLESKLSKQSYYYQKPVKFSTITLIWVIAPIWIMNGVSEDKWQLVRAPAQAIAMYCQFKWTQQLIASICIDDIDIDHFHPVACRN